MNRHAYLIMAFNHFDLLKKLIILLDDKRNDIFIHVDIKSEDFDESYFKNVTKYSNVYFIKRKAVFWADYSMIDVELDLLTNDCKSDKYKYYHLISGCDLPLKTQNEIHEFMDGNDYEYLGIYPKEVWYSVRRVKFYHNFTHLKSYRKNKFLKGIDLGIEYFTIDSREWQENLIPQALGTSSKKSGTKTKRKAVAILTYIPKFQ